MTPHRGRWLLGLPKGAVLAVVALNAASCSAIAHQDNPEYRSVVYGTTPAVKGLTIRVLGSIKDLQLDNASGRTVVVKGYQGEPYARVLADGRSRSTASRPRTISIRDQRGETPIPAFANAKAAPQWKILGRSGRLIWHDHRMHWMGTGVPPQVHDKAVETRVFDYRIPIAVGGRSAVIRGALFWEAIQPLSRSLWIVLALSAALLLAIALPGRRRKRSGEERVATVREAW